MGHEGMGHEPCVALREPYVRAQLEQQMNSTRVLEACRAEQEEELSTLRPALCGQGRGGRGGTVGAGTVQGRVAAGWHELGASKAMM